MMEPVMNQQPSAVHQGRCPEFDTGEAAAHDAARAAGQVSRNSRFQQQLGRPLIVVQLLIAAVVLGWCGGFASHFGFDYFSRDWTSGGVEANSSVATIDIRTVVERIIKAESDGNPDAKNKRSSATGLAQFLDETWIRLIRTHHRGESRQQQAAHSCNYGHRHSKDSVFVKAGCGKTARMKRTNGGQARLAIDVWNATTMIGRAA
jgi:hypothetical protein